MITDWLLVLAGIDKAWDRVVAPLGLAMAVLVTGHVLLSKRDVAASIGWIGLAFLSPVWGALLYYMFGINRVVRRAQQVRRPRLPRQRTIRMPAHDFAGHLEPLERAVRRITNRAAEDGNAIAVLRSGDEAYPAMLDAIAAARHSIALSTYIFANDAVGLRFVEALTAAAGRGVAVRVLLDGIGSGYFPPILRVMRRKGLRAALFMHSALPWRMPFLNLRCHKKLLVVDGTIGFAGGLNIAAENVLGGHPRHPVADTHFRFAGPVVAQLADAFARDWAFTTDEELEAPVWHPDLEACGTAVARVVSSGPDQDLEKLQFVLLEAIACATASITLMTPYFLPNDEIITALSLAAIRGVNVEIVVPARSNHRFVDLAMRAHIGPLLDHGARVWLGASPFNHSKLLVVDRRWSLVGSANWDTRSLRLNFELDLEVYSEPLAHDLEAFMRSHQHTRLRPPDLAARSLPVRLRDAGLRLLLPYI